MKKKLIMLLASSTILMFSTACSTNTNEQVKTQGNQEVSSQESNEPRTDLTFAFFRDIESLSPHTTAGEMWFQEMVYETLVSVENSGIEPCLAESWEISEDGLTYTFKIREGITFTDGVALDAHVIEKNFDNIWQDQESLKWLESIVLTESYGAVDDFTFEIKLKSPYYPLLTELGLARPYAIGSPNIFIEGEPRNAKAAIGTGPYIMGEHKKDEYLVMEVNENYWGNMPTIETVTMKVIPENQTRIFALENGEIDMVYGANVVDAATIEVYKENEDISYAISEPSLTKHLVLNSHIPGLDDIAVRTALSHAINKEAISQGIYYGLEAPADTLFAKNMPYCDIELEPFEYDMDKAAQILEDAGWVMGSSGIREKDGVKLSFSAIYDNNSVTDKPMLEYMQSELNTIGINLSLEGYERSTYFDMQKAGTFDIIVGVPWGNPYDPHTALASFRAPSYGDYQAISGLENHEEIFQAITDMLVEVDDVKRQETITFILTELHESAVHIPLVFGTNKAIYTSELSEVTFAPSAYTFPFWEFKY